MEGIIRPDIAAAIIQASIAVSATALVAFVVFLWREGLAEGQTGARVGALADIPGAAEIEEFVRSLTPEDFATAEKIAAQTRSAGRTPES
jgi:hypothetical protein